MVDHVESTRTPPEARARFQSKTEDNFAATAAATTGFPIAGHASHKQ